MLYNYSGLTWKVIEIKAFLLCMPPNLLAQWHSAWESAGINAMAPNFSRHLSYIYKYIGYTIHACIVVGIDTDISN